MSTDSSKIILITGCSSGFGLATAAHLASKGHRVIASMRNLTKQGSLQSELNKKNAAADIIQLDVTNQKSLENTFDYIEHKYGYLDVLVNNAGYGIGGFFEDLTEEEIRQQMETNFFGVQNVTRKTIPLMRQRKKGKIINISSVSGFSGSPAFGAYAASKWALEGFSESLHYELKLFGIDVHLIEPGTYKTNIFADNARYAKNFDNPSSPYYEVSQALKKRVMEHVNDCYKDVYEIGELIEKLINSSSASFRNIPDLESQIHYLLRKCLPFTFYSWLIKRFFLYKLYKYRQERAPHV